MLVKGSRIGLNFKYFVAEKKGDWEESQAQSCNQDEQFAADI